MISIKNISDVNGMQIGCGASSDVLTFQQEIFEKFLPAW
jgi:hypothetical protein